MTIEKFKRLLPEKSENKQRGHRWARLYGILLDIHKEIDPEIKKRNDAMEACCAELND
jgi:hypothetical protein